MGKKRRRKNKAAAAAEAGVVEGAAANSTETVKGTENLDAASAAGGDEKRAKVLAPGAVQPEVRTVPQRLRLDDDDDDGDDDSSSSTTSTTTSSKNRNSSSSSSSNAEAPPVEVNAEEQEENQRRANQKKLQQLVIRMRKRGKSEKEIRKAKIEFKRQVNLKRRIADPSTEANGTPKPKKLTKRQQHVEEWKARNMSDAEKKGRKHNLVVVPVLWRHKEEESNDILAACATIKKYLSSFGLDVWIDERTKYTPGQKFAYWEHLGVMLRVEIGAQEMARSCCTLSVCSVAGQVAKRIPGLPWDGRELIKQVQQHGKFQWLRI